MERSMRTVLLLVFLTVATIAISIGLCNGNLGVPCHENEKQALLIFKQDLKDPANRLLSWAGEGDCCSWTGVVCDNSTGHIRELHLANSDSLLASNPFYSMDSNFSLGGKINPSLLNLKHLTYLNLSKNNFLGTRIPSFFGSLNSLSHLDLSYSWFDGMIPQQLGNLSSICDLRLSGYGLNVENLQWISGLSQLKHLDMNHVNLSKASDWLQVTNMLPSLVELRLSDCKFDHIPLVPIINFTSLAILDLSYNNFSSLMPGWAFSLRNLVSINLSHCGFRGPIPSSPHNITSLKEIDFSFNDLNLSIPEWLFYQKHLTHLNLASNSLEGPLPGGLWNMTNLKVLSLNLNFINSTIPESLYSLNYLESLNLSDNDLHGEVLSSIGNLTSVAVLKLNNNHLGGKVPHSLGNLCNLIDFDLSSNNFSGNVSQLFESLSACSSCRVESLGLGKNNLSGHLTVHIGNFKNLRFLDLSENQFDGDLPEIIGHLKMLTYLDISYNSFKGVVSEVHFTHHTRLKSFIAKGNSLTLETHRDWLPPFQLEALFLDSWLLAPEFPMWLQKQRQLNYLSLSNTGISGTIPNWFWHSSYRLYYLNLSHNHLYGEIEYIDGQPYSSIIDLSSNQFNGTLPLVSSTVYILDLSNSSFSGSVFGFFCDKIDAPHQLSHLYVGNNRLSGKIPDCFMNWQELNLLDFKNNNLTGNIPSSIGHLVNLYSLHLRSNHLSGELPLSMQNCMNLVVLDLGENKFSGSLPIWIGKSLSNLVVLSFRSNKLQGDIPDQLCNLTDLQILNLAHNNLSGTIPRCFCNFSAMVNLSRSNNVVVSFEFNYGAISGKYIDNMFLVTKGREAEYSSILGLVTSMDLSDNIISGEIPDELTKLISLQTLNLSQNILTGRIPSKIGNMDKLESVDLSMNQLYGEIPASMTSLTFLSHLNLSYNNLTGRIPESTQLQSLDQSGYFGNELCGPPLIKNCSASTLIPPTVEQQRGYDLLKDQWFYLSLGLGFMVGFWSILGSLLINMPWSFAFSRFLNSIVLKLYGVIVEYV